jgi:hypothetical protein
MFVSEAIQRLPGIARAAAATLSVVIFGSASATAGDVPAGLDFQVNSYTTGDQSASATVHLSDGGFVVAWNSMDQDGSGQGIFAQRFLADGTPNGAEFQVNTYTTGTQQFPTLSGAPSGGFVVAWTRFGIPRTLVVRSYDSTGLPLGGELVISQATDPPTRWGSVGHFPSGEFVVVWSAPSPADPDGGLLAQRYDGTGSLLGTEFQVNSYTTGLVSAADVSIDATGDLVVAWTSRIDGNGTGVSARRFDGAGLPLGAELAVNTYTSDDQSRPSIGHDAAGNFVVAWQAKAAADGEGVYARRYDATGTAIAGEFRLDTGPCCFFADLQDVGVRPDGSFLALWSFNGDVDIDNNFSAYARRFDASDQPLGPQFLVSDHLPLEERPGAISVDAQGNVVTTWSDPGGFDFSSRDGSDQGVFARRYCSSTDPTCDVCVGFDDTVDADGDGIADGCDACTNPGGTREATRAKVDVRVKSSGITQKASRIVFNADFDLPGGGASFAAIDPIAQGMRIRIQSPLDDASIVDTTLVTGSFAGKGTAGWKINGAGTTWKYIDKREVSPTPPIFKLSLKDLSNSSPNRVRLRARGKRGDYETSITHVPLKASIALGDGSAASAGLCAEATFVAGDCTHTIGSARKLRCNR